MSQPAADSIRAGSILLVITNNISLGELLNLHDSLYNAVQMSDCMDLIPNYFNAYAIN